MNRTQKGILISLGGVAAIASAYYYFRLRNRERYLSYEQQLVSFQKEFFKSDIMKIGSMQIKFEQLFVKATQDLNNQSITIMDRIKYQGEDNQFELLKYDSCSRPLKQGAIYYECWDCSIVRQDIAKHEKKSEEQCIYMTVCEDCFEVSKHKGHKFTRHQASEGEVFRCSCGDQAFMQRENFCSEHLGYDNLIKVFEKEEIKDPRLWVQIENFFLDLFHIAFDKAADLLKNMPTMKKENFTSLLACFNTFLGFILDKVNEIIELNQCSMVFFTRLFQKVLTKPISILIQMKADDKKNTQHIDLILLNQKQINSELSILDYLLIFSKDISDKNDQQIATLFRKLIKVDDNFRSYFSERFFKYIDFTFKTQSYAVQNTNKQFLRRALPPLAHMMIEQVSLMSVFTHLVDKLGEGIFNPIDLFINYLETKPPEVIENDEVIYLLYNISFEMLKQINMLKVVLTKFYKPMIDKLFQLSFTLFKKNSIKFILTESNQKNSFLPNIHQVLGSLHLQFIEPQMLLCFINLYEGLLIIDDKEFTDKVITYICQVFFFKVLEAEELIKEYNQKNGCFISLSQSFITQLPLLIALSERKVFSEVVVNEFFKKHFMDNLSVEEDETEEEQQQMRKEHRDRLLKSVQFVLNSFITVNSESSFFVEMKFTQKRLNPNSADGQQLANVIAQVMDFICSASVRIYDYFTLTYQLVCLAQDESIIHSKDSIFYKQIAQFEKAKNIQTFMFITAETTYSVAQLFLDSSPFINVFAYTHESYFPELKDHWKSLEKLNKEKLENENAEETLNDKTETLSEGEKYNQNIQQIMISMVQGQTKKVFIRDIELLSKSVLHFPTGMTSYAQGIFKMNANQTLADNDAIYLLPSFEKKAYIRNFLRVYDEIYTVVQFLQDQNGKKLPLFPYVGSDHSLNSLFKFQIDLVNRILINSKYQEELVQLITQDSVYHHMAFFFSLQVYLTLSYLKKVKDNLESLSEEKRTHIIKILSIYQDQDNFTKLKKQIEEELSLSKKMITEDSEKQVLAAMSSLLDDIKNA